MNSDNTETDVGTPDIGTKFKHTDSGAVVQVASHMFSDLSQCVMDHSPFIVERQSDGKELGFEEPEQFYDSYERLDTEDQ